MSNNFDPNQKNQTDQVLVDIADYVSNYTIKSDLAYDTARNCLIDSLGCGFLALKFSACTQHLGPIVTGASLKNGSRVPGTHYQLDPVKAAFDIGCMIRWLDYNDTWLAQEWGHPSDNLGAILAVADYLSLQNITQNKKPLKIKDVLTAMIKAYEIQGILALENSFNKVGLDHVLLVRIASSAVAMHLLGGTKQQIIDCLSLAFADGATLRTYRHAPNTGSRKSWAAGDATSRALRLALMVLKGEMGLPSVLTTPTWGFYDVLFKSKSFVLNYPYQSYVMENILFKLSFPAEFHAQSAVECALKLHPQIKNRLNQIEKIELTTHQSAIRIISKVGQLNNAADRDHCLQYMVAVGLLEGNLSANHYEDDYHQKHPEIDQLRAKMTVKEDKNYSKQYLDKDKRSIANAIQIYFKDGSKTGKVEIHYPIGHKLRRKEGIVVLERKFENNLKTCFDNQRIKKIMDLCLDQAKLENTDVNQFMDLLVVN